MFVGKLDSSSVIPTGKFTDGRGLLVSWELLAARFQAANGGMRSNIKDEEEDDRK